jgi:hypothetical protein
VEARVNQAIAVLALLTLLVLATVILVVVGRA